MEEFAPWIQNIRSEGQQRWRETGWPSPRDESWRYTNLKKMNGLALEPVVPVMPDHFSQSQQLSAYCGKRGLEVVFLNGRYAPWLSNVSALPKGVRVGSLEQCLKLEHGTTRQSADATLIRQTLDRYAADQEDALIALNRANLSDGCVLIVDDGTVCSEPLHLIYVTAPEPGAQGCYPRTVISVGQMAQLHVVESYVGWGEAAYLTNAVTDVYLGQGAVLKLLKAQREAQNAFHLGTHRIVQSRESRFQAFHLSVGSQLARHNVNVQVKGEAAETELLGLYLTQNRQHVDFSTRISHQAPHCQSRQHYKGILDDQSRGVFRGTIHIESQAQQTNSTQLNNNLLLTSQAEVDTLPQLEIYADDVKATHGATVGQLNEEEIFYVRSRAVSEELARQMVMRGFAENLIQKLDVPFLAEVAHNLLATTLNEMAVKQR